MPSYTVHLAVDQEAKDAWEAVGAVKYALARLNVTELRITGVTDEMGKDVAWEHDA